MKKNLFLLFLCLMAFGYAQAQTGYCTKAVAADGTSSFDWSKAKNFCPILVSQDVYQTMQATGIKADYQVDDTNSHLWLWNGYTSLDASGVNSFGGNGGYLDLRVNDGAGWSGMGFINDAGIDLSFLNDDYYLHFGTRGATDTHNITFAGAAFSIGNGVMDGKENLGNWKNDGKWYYFDIPVSKLKQMGVTLISGYKDNYLTALSGGTGGVELVMENIFLYERTDGEVIVPQPDVEVPEPPYSTKANNADGTTTFNWADAQNFCPILVSQDVFQTMEAAGIKRDMQVDDNISHLWIWNGYVSNDASGMNSFGGNGGYLDLSVPAGCGWTGLGFINDGGLNLEFLDDSYYLHFGTKGSPSIPHQISLGGVNFSIGDGVREGPNFGTWSDDGQWYYFDVPLAKLRKIGNLFPGAANYKDNYLTALSGGDPARLVLENIFIYQKKSLAGDDDDDDDDNGGNTDNKPETIPDGPYYASAKTAPFNWENAADFCPIIVSDDVFNRMDAAGIKKDMQINDETTHLWIWENTYAAGSFEGQNSFGGEGGVVKFTVGNVGWSGLGLATDVAMDMSFLANHGYYLHFGTKGKLATHTISLGGVPFCIGEGTMEGNKNLGCWSDDGEWWYYDIPCALLKSMGNFFNTCSKTYKDNYMTVLSGGTAGTEVILENVFLYRKLDGGNTGGDDPDDDEEVIPNPPYSTKASDVAFDWDNAQNFCPIITSDDIYAKMEAAGIRQDMQINDETTHLWIWENTYNAGSFEGQNSFGGEGGVVKFTVGNAGWSGLGIVTDVAMNLSFLANKGYYLHFGTKGKPSTHTISLGGVSFCIGDGTMDGHKNLGTWTNDGEWWYFDIPLALLRQEGNLFPGASAYKDNYVTVLSGGTAGTELILENMFIYQKKNIGGNGGDDDTDVKYLVDYTPAKADNQRSFKRGIGENAFNNKGEMTALEPGVTWYYNWGSTPVTALQGTDVEYVPMAWNASGITGAVNCVKNNGAKYILGFNEPNFRSQANMTPTQAATAWKQLEDAVAGLDVELVAPALNYTDGPINDGNTYQPEQWMDAFINAYKGMNGGRAPRMDYLALHCYMNDHGAMKNFVEGFSKKYGKKVWLTEFCAWEGTVNEATQKTQMLLKLKDLEESDYVYRYAWFKAKGSNVAPYYRLLNGTNLTDLGASYVYSTTYDHDRYFTAGEQIPAKDYIASSTVDLEANTDADDVAQALQIGSFDMGASVKYQIDVPTKQVYTLALRMSDRAYLAPLKVGVYLDGSTTPVATQELSPTGKTATTDAWVTEGFNLELPAGKHVMEIRSLQSTDCKLQWLSFFHNEFTEDITDISINADGNDAIYNLQGQRVNANAKGILIKNGKKYLNK